MEEKIWYACLKYFVLVCFCLCIQLPASSVILLLLLQGCALIAPGHQWGLTFGFGLLRKRKLSSQLPGWVLLGSSSDGQIIYLKFFC